MSLRERVAYEDAVTFINAAFACTGQREFYGDREGQRVNIAFLHEYMRINYRRLYARCLAVDVNHFNRARIITELLSSGAETTADERRFEGALIRVALRRLPPTRALRALDGARRRRANNRRVRAVIRDYLAGRPDPDFDAVKYRGLVRALATHAHLQLPAERARFLYESPKKAPFETPIFDAYRRAHYEEGALYELPFSVAEGLAARLGVPRDRFLLEAEGSMTRSERARMQTSLSRADEGRGEDYSSATLAQLTSRLLAIPVDERVAEVERWRDRLEAAAARTLRHAPLRLGRVALVLDRSYSSRGSDDKPNRPLAVALAVQALVQQAAATCDTFWTAPVEDPVLVSAYGGTDIATPLLDALETEPELVLIVSDGFDNDPPGGAHLVLDDFRRGLDPDRKVSIVHLNPVFDDADFAPRALSTAVPTVGLRDAKDLPAALGFARLADGAATLEEVEGYLHRRAEEMLEEARDDA